MRVQQTWGRCFKLSPGLHRLVAELCPAGTARPIVRTAILYWAGLDRQGSDGVLHFSHWPENLEASGCENSSLNKDALTLGPRDSRHPTFRTEFNTTHGRRIGLDWLVPGVFLELADYSVSPVLRRRLDAAQASRHRRCRVRYCKFDPPRQDGYSLMKGVQTDSGKPICFREFVGFGGAAGYWQWNSSIRGRSGAVHQPCKAGCTSPNSRIFAEYRAQAVHSRDALCASLHAGSLQCRERSDRIHDRIERLVRRSNRLGRNKHAEAGVSRGGQEWLPVSALY